MPEIRERESQERFDWYKVNNLLLDIGSAGEELGLKTRDIVHIGGSATFYRCYQAFGSQTVPHFRGTHDMDLMCFNRGAIQRILDVLKTDPESAVDGYSIGQSASLPNKRSIYVQLRGQNFPGSSTGFEIDIYEPEQGAIRFNNRVMTQDKIVLDPRKD